MTNIISWWMLGFLWHFLWILKLSIHVGNLLNRTLGLLKKNCQSTLVLDSSIAAEGSTFKDAVEKLVKFLNAVLYISSNHVK